MHPHAADDKTRNIGAFFFKAVPCRIEGMVPVASCLALSTYFAVEKPLRF